MPFSGTIKKGSSIVGRGIIFRLIDMLAEKLNFNYTLVVPKQDLIGNTTHGMLSVIYNKVRVL